MIKGSLNEGLGERSPKVTPWEGRANGLKSIMASGEGQTRLQADFGNSDKRGDLLPVTCLRDELGAIAPYFCLLF
jgi:hypothetical protein